MKKTILSLIVLMLLAAPVMTSCSNDVAEEVSNNVMTITIAPPMPESETRVALDGLHITKWEENDIVTLYKITGTDYDQIDGEGKVFKCTDVTNGTFTCTDWGNGNINDYNLAVFGATAEVMILPTRSIIVLKPNYKVSSQLKDVIMMAAVRNNNAYNMMIVNNVVSIVCYSKDFELVNWFGKETSSRSYALFIPTVQIDLNNKSDDGFAVGVPFDYLKKGFSKDSFDQLKFNLPLSPSDVVYLNMGLAGGYETWCLAKKSFIDNTETGQILSPKSLDNTTRGRFFNARYGSN